MDFLVDISNLKSCLASSDPKAQMLGLEQAKKAIHEIAEVAVQGLSHTSNQVLYAERLSMLGPIIVPYVENLYRSSVKGKTKTSAAIMLLYFGSKVGLGDVIAALEIENPYQFLAASKLGNAGIQEASEPILNLLKAYAFTQSLDSEEVASKIQTLLLSFRKLGGEVHEEVKERLTAPGVSKYVSALVTQRMR
jgi:hypothetical protein